MNKVSRHHQVRLPIAHHQTAPIEPKWPALVLATLTVGIGIFKQLQNPTTVITNTTCYSNSTVSVQNTTPTPPFSWLNPYPCNPCKPITPPSKALILKANHELPQQKFLQPLRQAHKAKIESLQVKHNQTISALEMQNSLLQNNITNYANENDQLKDDIAGLIERLHILTDEKNALVQAQASIPSCEQKDFEQAALILANDDDVALQPQELSEAYQEFAKKIEFYERLTEALVDNNKKLAEQNTHIQASISAIDDKLANNLAQAPRETTEHTNAYYQDMIATLLQNNERLTKQNEELQRSVLAIESVIAPSIFSQIKGALYEYYPVVIVPTVTVLYTAGESLSILNKPFPGIKKTLELFFVPQKLR